MTPPTLRPVRRGWPWYLLVGSLAVNMLAGGFVVAHFLRPPPPPPGPEHALNRFIERAAKDLPADDVTILRHAVNEARPIFVRMDANRDGFGPRLRAELTAQPFDAERIRALFAANRTADDNLRAEIEARAVDTLKRLSPEARLRLAESRMRP